VARLALAPLVSVYMPISTWPAQIETTLNRILSSRHEPLRDDPTSKGIDQVSFGSRLSAESRYRTGVAVDLGLDEVVIRLNPVFLRSLAKSIRMILINHREQVDI